MNEMISLKLNKEFKRAYFQGKYKAHPLLVTYLLKNRLGKTRFGITASKKTGGAVQRNRARRIIKQAFFELLQEERFKLSGYDLVFVARSDTPQAKTPEIKAAMAKQIGGLLRQ